MVVAGFPLNDGGLFFTMVRDLRDTGGVLPHVTSYNAADIPFAYPPLALYLAAILATAGLDEFELLRWIPLLASIGTIPLVYVLAKELEGSWRVAAVAATVYALIPRSYEWLITGGGLTRSIGFVLALAAVWQGVRLISRPRAIHGVLTGLLGGLTVMTHPEAALFIPLSLAVFWMSFGRSRRSFAWLLGAALMGIAVSAPWWVTVIDRHGLEVLLGAADSRTASFPIALRQLVFGEFTGALHLDIFVGIGFVGLLMQLGRRRWVLPAWVLVIALGIVAAGFTFAAVPWSILVAIAVMEVILPASQRLAFMHKLARDVVILGLVGAGVLSSLSIAYRTDAPVHAVTASQVAAFEWIEQNTDPDARIAVVSAESWPLDKPSEWLPAIARRHSVATVQGYEWLPAFSERILRHAALQQICAARLADCLATWELTFGERIDYVMVPKGRQAGLFSPEDCCPAFRRDLTDTAEVVFDGDGGTIVRWRR